MTKDSRKFVSIITVLEQLIFQKGMKNGIAVNPTMLIFLD